MPWSSYCDFIQRGLVFYFGGFMKIELQVLKAKIRGFEIESQKIRRQIRKEKGVRRCPLWQRKRELGSYTRNHLLAYGILREIPYNKLERNAQSINIDAILDVIHTHVRYFERSKWTKERLEKLVFERVVS